MSGRWYSSDEQPNGLFAENWGCYGRRRKTVAGFANNLRNH